MLSKIKLLSILFLLALNSSCSLQNKEAVYIIPADYVGPIVIVFDQPDGVLPEIEDGFTVYRIPESGLLKVTNKAIYKINEQKYFYENLRGERTRIEYIYPTSQVRASDTNRKTFAQISADDKTIYAMGAEMGSFNSKNETVRYRAFKIGIVSENEKMYQQSRRRITELQRSMR